MTTVLIADDEEALLESFAEIVSALGYDVLTARDGEQALALAKAHTPDVIVSDHMMPRRTGAELMHALRAEQTLKNVPFILVSAARPAGLEEAFRFLAKPVALDSFESALKDAAEASAGRTSERDDEPPAGSTSALEADGSAERRMREQMLGWVAHEVKTPLSAAMLKIELLMRDLDAAGDRSTADRLRPVLKHLVDMNELANSVLDAARVSEGNVALHKERHDIRAFLAALVTEWRSLHPDTTFELDAPDGQSVVTFDEHTVTSILASLLSNAVKFGRPPKKVVVSLVPGATEVRVSVSDNGAGIVDADLPRVFDMFYRSAPGTGRGHGLGLYVASSLARLHGGELTARSEVGRGSTFTLVLQR